LTAPPLPATTYQNQIFQEGPTYILEYRDAQTRLHYRYTPASGSLHDLEVVVADEPPFLPSHYGGPRFVVDGRDIPIWETEPAQFIHTARLVDRDTLSVDWRAQFGQTVIDYTYRFAIQGKTLRLEVSSSSRAIGAFTLDRSEQTPNARIIQIPYLPWTNALLYRRHFISAFFDWERTNASRLEPMNEAVSGQSAAFAQTAWYLPNTAGARHPLQEVIYLTVSDQLAEVLPGALTVASPYTASLAGQALLDLWAERSFAEDAELIRALARRGIPNLIVVRHNWQRCGFDDCYPSVLPANPRWGGDAGLIELSEAAQQAGYRFALHENYVDLYPNAEDHAPEWVALQSDGTPVPAWFNRTTGVQSVLLSPSHSSQVAARFAPEIHRRYSTSGVYLDVSTAVNPSEKVDYNAAIPGNAQLRTTLNMYRQLLRDMREAHHAPIIGEGGHHSLYVGAADAVLAEDPARQIPGAQIPPIVHFDLLRLHPHLVRFGVGFYPWYFAQDGQPKWAAYTDEEHYRYMASEIAFCHGAYIPTPDSLGTTEQVVAFIQREVTLVTPVHRRCALASPRRILYRVNGEMSSVERALIEEQPWQVFVEYDNGLQAWVNLHPTENWPVTLPKVPAWAAYSAVENGTRRDFVGAPARASFVLPPNGWLAIEQQPAQGSSARAFLPLVTGAPAMQTVTFTPSAADISNPERGIYNWPTDFTPPALANYAAQGYTLVYQRETLRDYITSDLPAQYLSALAGRFQAVRQAGLKVILRFSYNEGETYPNPTPDASLAQVLRHIQQLAPVIEANKDVIAWIEAGFIGAWGEWHTSASGLDTPQNKATICDALFAHFPRDRFILFRYPGDFTAWYPQPLTEAQAFTRTAQARTGHHNDCFLASEDDWGTYYDQNGQIRADEWKAYIAQMGRFAPVSGETCNPNPPRSGCATALQEMAYLRWSAINEGWHPAVIQSWKDQGCYAEIRRRLGYRLALLEARFSANVKPNDELRAQVRLQNTGFASPLLARPVYLVLTRADSTLHYQLNHVDPRRWEPGEHTFNAAFVLPPTLPPGEYTLAFWLPDPGEALRADPRYALRFANEGIWDAAHGWHVLGTVRVGE
jgi:hypothetical protein